MVNRRPALSRGPLMRKMDDFAAARDQQLRIGEQPGRDIALIQQRIDSSESPRIKTMGFRVC